MSFPFGWALVRKDLFVRLLRRRWRVSPRFIWLVVVVVCARVELHLIFLVLIDGVLLVHVWTWRGASWLVKGLTISSYKHVFGMQFESSVVLE